MSYDDNYGRNDVILFSKENYNYDEYAVVQGSVLESFLDEYDTESVEIQKLDVNGNVIIKEGKPEMETVKGVVRAARKKIKNEPYIMIHIFPVFMIAYGKILKKGQKMMGGGDEFNYWDLSNFFGKKQNTSESGEKNYANDKNKQTSEIIDLIETAYPFVKNSTLIPFNKKLDENEKKIKMLYDILNILNKKFAKEHNNNNDNNNNNNNNNNNDNNNANNNANNANNNNTNNDTYMLGGSDDGVNIHKLIDEIKTQSNNDTLNARLEQLKTLIPVTNVYKKGKIIDVVNTNTQAVNNPGDNNTNNQGSSSVDNAINYTLNLGIKTANLWNKATTAYDEYKQKQTQKPQKPPKPDGTVYNPKEHANSNYAVTGLEDKDAKYMVLILQTLAKIDELRAPGWLEAIRASIGSIVGIFDEGSSMNAFISAINHYNDNNAKYRAEMSAEISVLRNNDRLNGQPKCTDAPLDVDIMINRPTQNSIQKVNSALNMITHGLEEPPEITTNPVGLEIGANPKDNKSHVLVASSATGDKVHFGGGDGRSKRRKRRNHAKTKTKRIGLRAQFGLR